MSHFLQQFLILLLYFFGGKIIRICQDMRSAMNKSIAFLDIKPQLFCRCYSFCHQLIQFVKRREKPLFLGDPLQRGCDEREPLVQFEARSRKGGFPSSVQALRTARQYLRIIVASSSCCSASRSIGRMPRTSFFSSFGVLAIRLVNWFCCFAQIVKLTQLMGSRWKRCGYSITDRMLTVRNHPTNGYGKHILHLFEQHHQVGLAFTEQRSG